MFNIIMPHVDLVLTLTESQPTQEVPLDVKFHRNITLVPGHSYEINCKAGQTKFTVYRHYTKSGENCPWRTFHYIFVVMVTNHFLRCTHCLVGFYVI